MQVKNLIADTQWYPSRRYGADRPRVSVLLPTFCRGQSGLFLRAAHSVLEQSLAELELIIVDDASTDGTAGQIAELMARDERVSLLRHPRNVGLPAVSEYEAFRKARAEYLAFAFDDDEFCPSALAELLAAAAAGSRAMVHGYVKLFVRDAATRREVGVVLGRRGHGQAQLRGVNYVPNNAVLLHRRVVAAVGFYDPHVAMARLCDWDLWRRVAEGYPITAAPIMAGWQHGPATDDSIGHTRLVDFWQSCEWMDMPRNAQLRPGAIEEYDVLAVPAGLSPAAEIAVREIAASFRGKFWYAGRDCSAAVPAAKAGGTPAPQAAGGDRPADGRLLVATRYPSASVALYFDHLPDPLRRRVRIAYPGMHAEEEMIGATAIVFVRDLLAMQPWIDHAQRLQIPCYYFLDDNFLLLGGRASSCPEFRGYTDDALRERLRGFAGVLLSSRGLLDYFRQKQLHGNLLYYPPIAARPAWRDSPPAPRKPRGTTRIAFFGGHHRVPAFQEQVLPAITRLAGERPVELFAAGMVEEDLAAAAGLKTTCFPFELSYDIALARLAACEIDLLVHPNSRTANNEYKTLNVLISAWAMGAVPVLSDGAPYAELRGQDVAVLCGPDPAAWHEALRRHADDGPSRQSLQRNLDAYCRRHYGGAANVAAIETLLGSHPAAGPALSDLRWRRAMQWARQGAASPRGPSWASRVVRQAARSIRHSLPGRAVRRVWRTLSLRPRAELHECVAPAFRPLLETPPAADWLRAGYRLRASRDLRRTPHLAYPLPAGLGCLSGLLLAPDLSSESREGWIQVEIAAADGRILAQDGTALSDIDPSVPTLFAFPPVATGAHQQLWLRVSGKELTAPVRILHWSKRGLRPGSRGNVRPFCAFRTAASEVMSPCK